MVFAASLLGRLQPCIEHELGEVAILLEAAEDGADLAAHELYNSRIRYYRMSDITIEIREEETTNEIVERLLLELPKGMLDPGARGPWRGARA